MKLERFELIEIHLPLRELFVISSGARQDRRILLLRAEGEGEEGWAECVAGEDPSYSYETTDTAWHMLTDFILPPLVGHDVMGPEELFAPVPWIRGHPMAKAAVEMSVWDLLAKSLSVPLWELLGASGEAVPVGVSVGLQPTDDALLEKVEGYLNEGYARVKIKIKPGRDLKMLARVRGRFPDAALMADANSAYTLADATLLREMDDLGLTMIEQPLGHEDIRNHAELQSLLRTPICLDESIRSVGDARLAIELGACRIINIKPGRVGGLASSRAIHDLCRSEGIPVWCGGMLESGIGRAHNLALAGLPGFTLPGDISASRRYWERDIVTPEFELANGRMAPAPGPGIGVTPDRDRIAELTVRSVEIAG